MLSSLGDTGPPPSNDCHWTTVDHACMQGFNIKVLDNKSEQECKAACLKEKGCLGVDWDRKRKKCSLNSVNSQTQAIDNPCDNTDYIYHELVCDSGDGGEPQCLVLISDFSSRVNMGY